MAQSLEIRAKENPFPTPEDEESFYLHLTPEEERDANSAEWYFGIGAAAGLAVGEIINYSSGAPPPNTKIAFDLICMSSGALLGLGINIAYQLSKRRI